MQMIIRQPRHPSHLCQDSGSISRTFLRQHCPLTICIELVELTNSVSVSVLDDKIQITILILRRGALSNQTIRGYIFKHMAILYSSAMFVGRRKPRKANSNTASTRALFPSGTWGKLDECCRSTPLQHNALFSILSNGKFSTTLMVRRLS